MLQCKVFLESNITVIYCSVIGFLKAKWYLWELQWKMHLLKFIVEKRFQSVQDDSSLSVLNIPEKDIFSL